MDQKTVFMDCTEQQLMDFYTKLRDSKKSDEILKAKIEGFMFAGVVLGLADNDEFKQLMERVHQTVFEMSVEERRISRALEKSDQDIWSIYDEPAWQRSKKR
jgi:hypothetical protein